MVETASDKYDEDRAYKMAVSEAKRDRLAEAKRKRDERRQAQANKRSKSKSRIEHLVKQATALEKEMTKRNAAERIAARSLDPPEWLTAGRVMALDAAKQQSRDPATWWPQLGDRCFYFAEGHIETIKKRRPKRKYDELDAANDPEMADAPPWLSDKKAPRVLEVVVTAVMHIVAKPEEQEMDLGAIRAKMRKRLAAIASTPEAEEWFNDPVDYEALGLDDYLSIVKEPMDLSTVRSKLTTYRTVEAFEADVAKVFKNALVYNRDDSAVAKAAAELWRAFRESHEVEEESTAAEVDTKRLAVRLRLVPAYMIDDARQRDDDEDDDNPMSYITYGGPQDAPFVIDAFNVRVYRDSLTSFLIPRHVVRRACAAVARPTHRSTKKKPKVLPPLKVVASGNSGGNSTEQRFVLRSVAPASKETPHLPAWKAAKLVSADDAAAAAAAAAAKRKYHKKEPPLVLRNVWQIRPADLGQQPGARASSRRALPSVVDLADAPRRASSRISSLKHVKDDLPSPPRKPKQKQAQQEEPREEWLATNFPGVEDDGAASFSRRAAEAMAEAIEAVGRTELGKPYFWPPADGPIENAQPWQVLCCESLVLPPRLRDLRDRAPPSATPWACFRDVADRLRRGDYRRKEAAYDDLRHVYFAESTLLMQQQKQRTPHRKGVSTISIEKRVFNAKLAVQLCFALLSDDERTSTDEPRLPWPAHIRQIANVKNNAGKSIREGVKLAITAARRDLANEPTTAAAVIAELRLALAMYRGNAAGPCRELALKAVDVYGGWYLGAEVAKNTETVRYVRSANAKTEASVLLLGNRPTPPPYHIQVGACVKLPRQGEIADVVQIDHLNAICRKRSDSQLVDLHLNRATANTMQPKIDKLTRVAFSLDGRKFQCANDFYAYIQQLAHQTANMA